MLGPQRQWLELHDWPPELLDDPHPLVLPLAIVLDIALFAGSAVLVVLSLQRLLRLLHLEDPALRLVREGLGDRGVAGTMELFRRDAGRAYEVLDRDHVFGPAPTGALRRFVHR